MERSRVRLKPDETKWLLNLLGAPPPVSGGSPLLTVSEDKFPHLSLMCNLEIFLDSLLLLVDQAEEAVAERVHLVCLLSSLLDLEALWTVTSQLDYCNVPHMR